MPDDNNYGDEESLASALRSKRNEIYRILRSEEDESKIKLVSFECDCEYLSRGGSEFAPTVIHSSKVCFLEPDLDLVYGSCVRDLLEAQREHFREHPTEQFSGLIALAVNVTVVHFV